MGKRYEPSPVQLCLALDVAPPVPAPKPTRGPLCPAALRHGQDQWRCRYCGIAWDIDEERPSCDTPDHHP